MLGSGRNTLCPQVEAILIGQRNGKTGDRDELPGSGGTCVQLNIGQRRALLPSKLRWVGNIEVRTRHRGLWVIKWSSSYAGRRFCCRTLFDTLLDCLNTGMKMLNGSYPTLFRSWCVDKVYRQGI